MLVKALLHGQSVLPKNVSKCPKNGGSFSGLCQSKGGLREPSVFQEKCLSTVDAVANFVWKGILFKSKQMSSNVCFQRVPDVLLFLRIFTAVTVNIHLETHG